jgi:hypothetical protein
MCYTGDILDPKKDKYTAEILCGPCEGAGAPWGPRAGD